MEKTLTILEVSQKQAYIFGSKKLRENAARSGEIAFVTSEDFFRKVAGALYRPENLVYAGGGHTVLQFDDRASAVAFTQAVTEAALRRFGGLELFATHHAYDPALSPGENLQQLSRRLEEKKALRAASFRQLSFGVEALDPVTFRPVPIRQTKNCAAAPEIVAPPEGYTFPADLSELAGDDNFIAVVHLDGNGMGARVNALYSRQAAADWNTCCQSLRRFSEGVQRDFEAAFSAIVEDVTERLLLPPGPLPIRPVILAGDDVCFVTKGSLGLECARLCLEKLAATANPEDGKPYAACAGVAIVHTKYPFHQAYDLSEELCASAKRFGAALDANGGVSAMDWHIEFGQLKDSLAALREDYETEDGCRLELRPVAVCLPERCAEDAGVRTYAFFAGLCRTLQQNRSGIARGKVKELREALKQGEVESRFYLRDREIARLLDQAFDAEYQRAEARMERFRAMLFQRKEWKKDAFRLFADGKRCLFFDAIELADHWEPLEVSQ